MKIVYCSVHNAAPVVPVNGGHQARFVNHRAILPDEVADVLVGMGGGMYRIEAQDLSALPEAAKILVIRDNGLGDVLLLTPLLRGLTEKFGAIVDVQTMERYRCLFDGNCHVRQTFAIEQEGDQPDTSAYDVVLDLRLVVENAERAGVRRHRADAFAEYADIHLEEDDRHLDYFVSDAERYAIQERFWSLQKRSRPDGSVCPVIGYVWRASTGIGGNRSWSVWMHSQVIEQLLAAGYVVILLDNEPIAQVLASLDVTMAGAKVDQFDLTLPADCNLIDWSGQLSIREVGAVLDYCDAVISPDTGLFHLAGALDKPTLTYFGAFPVAERHTHRDLVVVNEPSHCPLSPCYSYRCLNRDPFGQARCLGVDPAKIVAELGALLKKTVKETDTDAEVRFDTGLGGSPADGDPAAQGDGDDLEAGNGATGLVERADNSMPTATDQRNAGRAKRRNRRALDPCAVLPTQPG